MTKKLNGQEKNKAEKKAKITNGESDADFLKRIMSIKETAIKKAGENSSSYRKEMEEAKAQGAGMGKMLAEREECEKIVEEFKKNPPLVISKSIAGISVEYRIEDKYKAKVDQLKKYGFSFIQAVHSTSITPLEFTTFGNVYIKRGSRKAFLPISSSELPFIIRDGDIIGTEKSAFVLELKDEYQDEENNFWHVFLFPNSELKISIFFHFYLLPIKTFSSCVPLFIRTEAAFVDISKISPISGGDNPSTNRKYTACRLETLISFNLLKIYLASAFISISNKLSSEIKSKTFFSSAISPLSIETVFFLRYQSMIKRCAIVNKKARSFLIVTPFLRVCQNLEKVSSVISTAWS